MGMIQTDGIERKALIFNVQKYNMYDGPGIRTMVFFKGCPLRCKWCSNPEGIERKYQIMLKKDACMDCGRCAQVCTLGIHKMTGPEQRHEIVREIDCHGCGACVQACLSKALSVVGEQKSISELLDIIEEDRAFYEMSGGGVTLGGGEVMMQPEAAISLLTACKQRGIHTAVETCGYTNPKTLMKAAPYVDLFLYDIKHMDPQRHLELTGVRNETILENLQELLHRRYHVKVRMPLLRGLNDSEQDIQKLIRFLLPYREYKNFKGIDLLPYHKLGVGKYRQMNMIYPIEADLSFGDGELDRIENRIRQYDFSVAVIRH